MQYKVLQMYINMCYSIIALVFSCLVIVLLSANDKKKKHESNAEVDSYFKMFLPCNSSKGNRTKISFVQASLFKFKNVRNITIALIPLVMLCYRTLVVI